MPNVIAIDEDEDEDEDRIKPVAESSNPLRRLRSETRSMNTRTMSKATSVDRAVSSIFVLGSTTSGARRSEDKPARRTPTIDLSSMTREELGGVEYRALQVLLKVTIGMYRERCIWLAHADYYSRILRRPTHAWSRLLTPMDPHRTSQVSRLPRITGSR